MINPAPPARGRATADLEVHTFAVPSADADSNRRSPGDHTSEYTIDACSLNSCRHLPVSVSISRMGKRPGSGSSQQAAASSEPDPEKARVMAPF